MSPRRPFSTTEDAQSIDERYGLEPVFEPDQEHEREHPTDDAREAAGTQPFTVECPYCGESFETLLDLSAGSASYIEDCTVCCQPIEFDVRTDAQGRLSSVSVTRGD